MAILDYESPKKPEAPASRLSKMAVSGLVMAILAFPCLSGTLLLHLLDNFLGYRTMESLRYSEAAGKLIILGPSALALMFNYAASVRIRRAAEKLRGVELVTQGMVLSILWIVFVILERIAHYFFSGMGPQS
jgi:hypothetical protein